MSLNPEPLLFYKENVKWTNKHFNIEIQPKRLYDAWNRLKSGELPKEDQWKAGLNCLRQIVIDAEAANVRTRGFGGGWSLSDAAVTNDYLVNTKPLNLIDTGLSPDSVVPSQKANADKLVFVQSGVQVRELNQKLEAKGLALPTSGASDGQTICGAVSTGTHGSALTIGAMQDYVVGIHIVGEGGNHYWIERASEPIVADSFVGKLGAIMVRNDNLFNSMLVSFGSFGLIHALLLRVEPIYLLEVYQSYHDWNSVKDCIGTFNLTELNLPRKNEVPFHFEVDINPYCLNDGEKGAIVKTIYKIPFNQEFAKPPQFVNPVFGTGADLLCIIGTISDAVPGSVPVFLGSLLKTFLEPINGNIATPGNVFTGGFGGFSGRGLSTEIGIDLPDVPSAVEGILKVAQDLPFAGLIALRYVKKSKALLAFTKFDITCAIELPSAGSERTLQYFDKVWEELEKRNINYTLHWGQCNCFNKEKVRKMWGGNVDLWIRARQEFLPGAGRKTFSNDLLERCGLEG